MSNDPVWVWVPFSARKHRYNRIPRDQWCTRTHPSPTTQRRIRRRESSLTCSWISVFCFVYCLLLHFSYSITQLLLFDHILISFLNVRFGNLLFWNYSKQLRLFIEWFTDNFPKKEIQIFNSFCWPRQNKEVVCLNFLTCTLYRYFHHVFEKYLKNIYTIYNFFS